MRITGNQRKAVLRAFRTPCSAKQILDRAKLEAPQISQADLHHILNSFVELGLARFHVNKAKAGRIFYLTAKGWATAELQLENFSYKPPIKQSDWHAYSTVLMSRNLRAILKAFTLILFGTEQRTPTQLRKQLQGTTPLSSSSMNDNLKRLHHLGLIKKSENPSRDSRRAYYSLTPKGRKLADYV